MGGGGRGGEVEGYGGGWKDGGRGQRRDCFLRMTIQDAKHKPCTMSVEQTDPELSLRSYLSSSLEELLELTCKTCA